MSVTEPIVVVVTDKGPVYLWDSGEYAHEGAVLTLGSGPGLDRLLERGIVEVVEPESEGMEPTATEEEVGE